MYHSIYWHDIMVATTLFKHIKIRGWPPLLLRNDKFKHMDYETVALLAKMYSNVCDKLKATVNFDQFCQIFDDAIDSNNNRNDKKYDLSNIFKLISKYQSTLSFGDFLNVIGICYFRMNDSSCINDTILLFYNILLLSNGDDDVIWCGNIVKML